MALALSVDVVDDGALDTPDPDPVVDLPSVILPRDLARS